MVITPLENSSSITIVFPLLIRYNTQLWL